jgi:hypothetical protein
MKDLKVTFRAGRVSNMFTFYPVLSLTGNSHYPWRLDFAIQLQLFRYAIGVRFERFNKIPWW